MKKQTISVALIIIILACLQWNVSCAQPPLMLRKVDLEQIKKAEIYLNKQLQMYERRRADNYTLYLAVKNYADRLNTLQQEALMQFEINSAAQKGNNKINKVLVGSSKVNLQGSFDLVQKSQLDSSKNYLYFKKWKIDTHNILDIQQHPENVISYNKPHNSYAAPSQQQRGLFSNFRYLVSEHKLTTNDAYTLHQESTTSKP